MNEFHRKGLTKVAHEDLNGAPGTIIIACDREMLKSYLNSNFTNISVHSFSVGYSFPLRFIHIIISCFWKLIIQTFKTIIMFPILIAKVFSF
jgi:hypothetical protein